MLKKAWSFLAFCVRLTSKFATCTNMIVNKFSQKSVGDSKNAKCDSDFESDERVAKSY
jgi:hypothetical protein